MEEKGFKEVLENFRTSEGPRNDRYELLYWIFNESLSVNECFEKIKNHITHLKNSPNSDFKTELSVILGHMHKITARSAENSFYELIMEERRKDEGLKEAENRKLDPPEPPRFEEKIRYKEGPSGWLASILDERETTSHPQGVFKEKIEGSEKLGRSKNHSSQENKGIQLRHAYALVRCNRRKSKTQYPCWGLMIVSRGQKTKECPRCERTISLASDKTRIIAQSNERKELIEKMAKFRWKMMQG